MIIDKLIARLGFVLAAVATVTVLGFTIDHLPTLNALAR
jgi:hypothetical protein